MKFCLVLVCFLFLTPLFAKDDASAVNWSGPLKGPRAQASKKVYFIASDLKNGGVLAVSQSFQAAAEILKWKTEILNGDGNRGQIRTHIQQAVKNGAEGIVLGGFDAADYYNELKAAKRAGAILVGWHAAAKPGPVRGMFANITTDPLAVAHAAALELPKFGAAKAGVIIITDRRFTIATVKTLEMKKVIESMKNIKLLGVEDVAISDAETEMPNLLKIWNQRFGAAWTHTLAINDIYFDTIKDEFQALKRTDIVNFAAGDGSALAIQRIKEGTDQQVVTVAEPLKAQGWQIADEMNRAFAGYSPSGFVTKPIVVSHKMLTALPSTDIEAPLNFREPYTKIWVP